MSPEKMKCGISTIRDILMILSMHHFACLPLSEHISQKFVDHYPLFSRLCNIICQDYNDDDDDICMSVGGAGIPFMVPSAAEASL